MLIRKLTTDKHTPLCWRVLELSQCSWLQVVRATEYRRVHGGGIDRTLSERTGDLRLFSSSTTPYTPPSMVPRWPRCVP